MFGTMIQRDLLGYNGERHYRAVPGLPPEAEKQLSLLQALCITSKPATRATSKVAHLNAMVSISTMKSNIDEVDS